VCSFTLYSRCGYSLYHPLENLHCFFVEMSWLSGYRFNFGW
jgi:hypothetical protein